MAPRSYGTLTEVFIDLEFSLGCHRVSDFFYRLSVDPGARLRYRMVSVVDILFSTSIDSLCQENRGSALVPRSYDLGFSPGYLLPIPDFFSRLSFDPGARLGYRMVSVVELFPLSYRESAPGKPSFALDTAILRDAHHGGFHRFRIFSRVPSHSELFLPIIRRSEC